MTSIATVGKILITAHAGCQNTPQDSLESVMAGLGNGADIVEVDLRFVDQRIPVLSHDPIIPEQKASLVRLKPVLEILEKHPYIQLNLDLKEVAGVGCLNSIIAETGMAQRVFFTGLEPEMIPAVRAVTTIPYLVNYEPDATGCRESNYLQQLVVMTERLGAFGINLEYHDVSERLIRAFHAAGLQVYVWTVDDEPTMDRLILMGVDSITSNRVDQLAFRLRG